MISMKDIAKKCNVSIASVSKALNGYPDIGEQTRELIIQTAKDMGYIQPTSAKVIKPKRSYMIGVLFADESTHGLTHDYFNHVLESFKATAEKRGYDITFTSGNFSGRRMSYYEHCKYRGVDGVLVACINYRDDYIQDLIRSDIPVVTIDHVYEGKIAVFSDNVTGIEDLVNYVVDRGHKKIAYIHGQDNPVTKNRLTSFYRGLQKRDIDVPDDYVKSCRYRDPDTTAILTAELLDLNDPPTCILFSDDYAALGGINEINRRGMKIPEDISICGYDGLNIAKLLSPKLVTIEQDTKGIGELAANKLIDQIETPKTTLIDKYYVTGRLFVGESVKEIL